jgi:hypothetical protein
LFTKALDALYHVDPRLLQKLRELMYSLMLKTIPSIFSSVARFFVVGAACRVNILGVIPRWDSRSPEKDKTIARMPRRHNTLRRQGHPPGLRPAEFQNRSGRGQAEDCGRCKISEFAQFALEIFEDVVLKIKNI